MNAPIPVLDRLGADLESALRARPRRSWPRTHPVLAAVAALAVLAVPAAATAIDWAGLVNGEIALPTQTPPGVRTVLASGREHDEGAWQLVVYKAAITGREPNRPGLCAYITELDRGTGRCVTSAGDPALLVASTSGIAPIGGIVSPRAERIELTLSDGRRLAVAPQEADPALLARRGLPRDLRFFIVDTGPFAPLELAGALVRDASGDAMARFGKPRPVPASAPLLSSPVTINPGSAP